VTHAAAEVLAIPVGPLPVPPRARTVLVFGGTFDPPHRGHVELPSMVRQKVGADWILYVPAALSPLKKDNPLASDADRVEMLRLALLDRGETNAAVATLELDRARESDATDELHPRKPSYTLDTLRYMRRELGERATLRLLIGADQAAQFHKWREPREIIRIAEPLVMLRTPMETVDRLMDALEPHWTEPELADWRTRIVEVPVVDAEATKIRAALLKDGPESPLLDQVLPPAVLREIRSRGIYANAKGSAAE
jgi:nicotinate-nucleotide adenylyltransferase